MPDSFSPPRTHDALPPCCRNATSQQPPDRPREVTISTLCDTPDSPNACEDFDVFNVNFFTLSVREGVALTVRGGFVPATGMQSRSLVKPSSCSKKATMQCQGNNRLSVRSYLSEVSDAIKEQRRFRIGGLSGIVAGMCGLIIAYLSLAIAIRIPNGTLEFHFVEERGAVTALSAILLAMAAALSAATAFLARTESKSHVMLWTLFAGGFLFLSLDELMQFHERVGYWLDDRVALASFRGWNDLVVIAYGIVALPVAAILMPKILSYPRLVEMLGTAFTFYAFHTLIDTLQEPPTTVSIIIEESSKVLCAGFLVLTAFTGLARLAGSVQSNAILPAQDRRVQDRRLAG